MSKLNTGDLYTKDLCNSLEITKNSFKTATRRLIKKQNLIRNEGKKGKLGMVNFSISKELKHTFMKSFNSSYNSNSSYKKTIITKEEEVQKENTNQKELPDDWKQIDTSPLKDIGMTINKLIDLYIDGHITSEGVQESINHFAWGLEHNKENYKDYKNLLKVFIGRVRKGHIWTESTYKTPKERFLEEMLKLKKQQREKEDKLIDEMVKEEFPKWESNLSDRDKEGMLPKNNGMFIDRATRIKHLKKYYKENVLIPRLNNDKL